MFDNDLHSVTDKWCQEVKQDFVVRSVICLTHLMLDNGGKYYFHQFSWAFVLKVSTDVDCIQ